MAKRALGIAKLEHPRQIKVQKWYFRFLMLNLPLGICLSWTAVCNLWKLDLINFIIALFQEGLMIGFTYLTLFFIKSHKKFEKCLKSCEKWHEVNVEVRQIFNESNAKSSKIFMQLVTVFPFFPVVTILLYDVLMSLVNGRLTPMIPRGTENLVFLFLDFANIAVYGPIIILVESLISGIIFVSINYFCAVIDAMKLILKDLNGKQSAKKFKETIRIIVDIHCDLVEQQRYLVDLTQSFVFVFEMICYGIFLISWIIFQFDPDRIFIASAASGLTLPFIFLTLMNEKLGDSYDDLQKSLINVRWYDLEPDQRKMLQPIMIIAERPYLLKSGPFHTISFEQLSVMADKIYSYGLIINNLAA